MIPDGDRRHGTVSRDVIGKVEWRLERDEDVVRVFVLRHDLLDAPRGLLSESPLENIMERAVIGHVSGQLVHAGLRQFGPID